MGVPSTRTPVRIARGTYANLTTVNALAALEEGEICYATDLERLYVKQGGTIKAVSATTNAAPAPGDVTASPAFVSGTGTQSDPYIITNGAVAFSGGTLESTQEITLNATAGDIVVLTDNSGSGSGTRFANQDVGIVNSAGKFTFKLKYIDSPGTTTNNTTYTGDLQIGTTYFSWVVVQSNFTQLSQATATTISTSGLGVGDTVTATEGTVTGGTSPYTYSTRWQRSFNGTDGWFNTGSTGTTYTFAGPDAGYYVRAVTTGTDSTASNQGGPLTFDIFSASTPQINTLGPATVGSFVLSEDNSSGARYTSQSFSAVATLNPEGVPTTTKNLKVTLGGTFSSFPATSNVTTITENDAIGTNVNQTVSMSTGNGGGSSSSNSYYEWCAPIFYRGTGGSGFLNMPLSYSTGNNLQLYKTQDGIINNNPYSSSASSSSGNTQTMSMYQYYTDTSLTTIRDWYQYYWGSTGSSSVITYLMYKPDCLLVNKGSDYGGFQFIDNISTKTSEVWRPILQNYQTMHADSGSFFAHIGTEYATFWSSITNMYVATGDLTDYANNTTSTTQVTFNWNPGNMGVPSGYASPYFSGQWAHGNKITFVIRFTQGSNYRYRLYTCDFSVNDGTSTSHWVFKQEISPGSSGGLYSSFIAVNPLNTNQIVLGFTNNPTNTGRTYYSGNGGESYSSITVTMPNWQSLRIWGYTWARNKMIAIGRGFYNGTGDSNGRWFYAQSSNGGTNWTPAIRSSQNYSYYNTYGISPREMLEKRGHRVAVANGGWIFGAGRNTYWGSSYYYYRCGLYAKDNTELTFADTTNLGNNTFRSGDRIRQGAATGSIGVISSNTMTLNDIQGTFSTGSPVTNTVSYFGGNISTMYAQINSSGTVTDLSTSDPGFTNVGYLLDNTITFPATLPSGNTPDVELPSGTTIKVDAQFTNSQGTVSATSNTLTPS